MSDNKHGGMDLRRAWNDPLTPEVVEKVSEWIAQVVRGIAQARVEEILENPKDYGCDSLESLFRDVCGITAMDLENEDFIEDLVSYVNEQATS